MSNHSSARCQMWIWMTFPVMLLLSMLVGTLTLLYVSSVNWILLSTLTASAMCTVWTWPSFLSWTACRCGVCSSIRRISRVLLVISLLLWSLNVMRFLGWLD